MAQTQTSAPVSRAAAIEAQIKLQHVRKQLTQWLAHRQMNDEVLAGTRVTKVPREQAIAIIQRARDPRIEQKLANHMFNLLTEVMPDVALPSPDITANPTAAVQLAQIVITGQPPATAAAPAATGATHPWLWPVVIVGGLLLAVTTAIGAWADVAKTREEYACIQSGACTDYGFWLKVGGVAALAWFVWTQTGVKDAIRNLGKGGRRT